MKNHSICYGKCNMIKYKTAYKFPTDFRMMMAFSKEPVLDRLRGDKRA